VFELIPREGCNSRRSAAREAIALSLRKTERCFNPERRDKSPRGASQRAAANPGELTLIRGRLISTRPGRGLARFSAIISSDSNRDGKHTTIVQTRHNPPVDKLESPSGALERDIIFEQFTIRTSFAFSLSLSLSLSLFHPLSAGSRLSSPRNFKQSTGSTDSFAAISDKLALPRAPSPPGGGALSARTAKCKLLISFPCRVCYRNALYFYSSRRGWGGRDRAGGRKIW
jgi:hypothetical protein